MANSGTKNQIHVEKANVCNKYNPILRDLKRVNCNREYLFSYINENREISRITERHINNYLKRYNPSITVKMFRIMQIIHYCVN